MPCDLRVVYSDTDGKITLREMNNLLLFNIRDISRGDQEEVEIEAIHFIEEKVSIFEQGIFPTDGTQVYIISQDQPIQIYPPQLIKRRIPEEGDTSIF